MAFTVTLRKQTTFGDQKVYQYKVTADANSGVIVTGLKYVDSCFVSLISGTAGGQNVKPNLNAASATANGSIMASTCTNGDDFFLIVYGH